MASMIDTESFRGTAAASHRTGGRGGGGVDEIPRRLTAVESTVEGVRKETSIILADVSAIKAQVPHLSTKADLLATKADLQEGIAQLRTEFHAFQTRLIQWQIGTGLAVIAAFFAFIKLIRP
jgi:uncharacterized protein YoxC